MVLLYSTRSGPIVYWIVFPHLNSLFFTKALRTPVQAATDGVAILHKVWTDCVLDRLSPPQLLVLHKSSQNASPSSHGWCCYTPQGLDRLCTGSSFPTSTP